MIFVLLEIKGMLTFKKSHLLVPALMLLSACGGGDGCSPSDGRPLDTTTDTSANCADTRAASSVVIAFGGDGSIEQLDGDSAALYSRFGSTIVRDQNSNPVGDGVLVQLDVFDTLIARGTIAAGDTISGSTITDNAGIFQGNGTTATTLNTAVVTRNSDPAVGIRSGDLVLLRNAATSDQIRYVVSTTANSITVDEPYNNTYPSGLYPGAQYLVGTSAVGAKIHGFDEDLVITRGLGRTINGTANFRLEYPNSILRYGASTMDGRFFPLGSTEVWVVANVGGRVATASLTSFVGIVPGTISIDPATVTAAGNVTVTLEDANGNRLPFSPITTSSDTAGTSATGCTTDLNGECVSAVTYGGAAAITYTFDGTTTGELTVE